MFASPPPPNLSVPSLEFCGNVISTLFYENWPIVLWEEILPWHRVEIRLKRKVSKKQWDCLHLCESALAIFNCNNKQPEISIQMVYNKVCFLLTRPGSYCCLFQDVAQITSLWPKQVLRSNPRTKG